MCARAPGDAYRRRDPRDFVRSGAGTLARNSSSHAVAGESLGARQSPLGESDPPELTFGPFGTAERLNWLVSKNRLANTLSHFLMSARS